MIKMWILERFCEALTYHSHFNGFITLPILGPTFVITQLNVLDTSQATNSIGLKNSNKITEFVNNVL